MGLPRAIKVGTCRQMNAEPGHSLGGPTMCEPISVTRAVDRWVERVFSIPTAKTRIGGAANWRAIGSRKPAG
jgi:hypothetical protein